jgi:hypothetical protein
VKSTGDPLFRTGRPLARTFGDGVACLLFWSTTSHTYSILFFVLALVVSDIALTALSQQPTCRKSQGPGNHHRPQSSQTKPQTSQERPKYTINRRCFLTSLPLAAQAKKDRTNTAAGIFSYAWDVTKYPRLTGSCTSVRGKQNQSPPSRVIQASCMHASLQRMLFPRLQDSGRPIRIDVPCLRLASIY